MFTATGKYIDFFDQFFESAEKYFLKGRPRTYFLFTDSDRSFPSKIRIIKVPKLGFPGDTIQRYHRYVSIEKLLRKDKIDAVYHIDVDMRFVGFVGDDILPDKKHPLIAVRHPDVNRSNYMRFAETNPDSEAFIDPGEGFDGYFVGGVQGGGINSYLNASKIMAKKIDMDKKKLITAKYHDQSHWNRYIRTHRSKFKFMSKNYCYTDLEAKFCFCLPLLKFINKNFFYDDNYYRKNRDSGIKIINLFKNHYAYKNEKLGFFRKLHYKIEFWTSLIALKISPSLYYSLRSLKSSVKK